MSSDRLSALSVTSDPLEFVSKRECLFKIIVVGDIATGKTSLIQRYVHNVVPINYKPTLGVDFATKLIQCDEMLLRLQFWDISGQERYANMTRVYYRDTHGAVVLYDCKRPETLDGAFRWKKDMDTKLALNNEQPIPAILIANKCDLVNNISEKDLENAVGKGDFRKGFKVSALTGFGVDDAIEYLVRCIVNVEQDGLYMMPIFQRDHQIRELNTRDRDRHGKRRQKGFFENHCC